MKILMVFICALLLPAYGQESPEKRQLSPADTVKEFYRLLREKQYREGFALSVYADAITGLTDEELAELSGDFEQTFANIPKEIKVFGAQSSGNNATVFMKSSDDPADPTAEELSLIKVEGVWRVGDLETYRMVKASGNRFFFEVKMLVNEKSAISHIERMIGAQKLYSDSRGGKYGSIDELVEAQFWLPSQKDPEMFGYRFTIELAEDRKSYWIHAEPVIHGKTGKHSFYGDQTGVYKLDNGGKVYRPELRPAK